MNTSGHLETHSKARWEMTNLELSTCESDYSRRMVIPGLNRTRTQ